MFDILALIPRKKKLTVGGWYSFNAICCHHRGHKPDKRGRGGIKKDGENWAYACFNCGFKCGFTLGKPISDITINFLTWCGAEETQIRKWSLESLKYKDLLDYINIKKQRIEVKFKETELPNGELLDVDNTEHKIYVDYLRSRAIDPLIYPFMVTPHEQGRMANRIIVPYTYQNKVVGYTSRFLDDKNPRYINHQQSGYVFGIDFQKPEWEVCLLVEGIFDALSINGCALSHNTINSDQATILAQLNKKVIFIPDHDKTGLEPCEHMLELGYAVSIPDWEPNVKDVNDAVKRYGKLPTLLSILQNATNNKVKVELKRKKLVKRI